MTVRAARVIGPIVCSAGTTVLATPPVGVRWKIDEWFLYNPGALDALASFELGPSSAARLKVWKSPAIPSGGSVVLPWELCIDATDSFAIDVPALDVVHLTLQAFVLRLP